MPQPEHEIVLWSVAGRFHFTETELRAMPLSRLRFWYRGHERMDEEERAQFNAVTGKKDE